jgi:hypothetical protein
MIELLLFCAASILAAVLMVSAMIGMGGIVFLLAQLFHYFQDVYHEHRKGGC